MENNDSLINAAAWFAYAVEDIKSARVLNNSGQYPAACFHAQQAAEKSFKGLLSATGDLEKSHSVSQLSKKVRELKYDEVEQLPQAGRLDRFYIATRYPDALPGSSAIDVFDSSDATEAIGIAEQTFLLLAKWAVDAGIPVKEKLILLVREGNQFNRNA